MDKVYILVAGSRSFSSYLVLERVLDKIVWLLGQVFQIDDLSSQIIIVEGGARGADELAKQYADNHGFQKIIFRANWTTYGKKAGFLRNVQMHEFISNESRKRICVCFWDGKSSGTKHNFDLSSRYGTALLVYNSNGEIFNDLSHL